MTAGGGGGSLNCIGHTCQACTTCDVALLCVDSDGSCDEHTREVERLRDNVKRGKAKRLGIPFRPPTKVPDLFILQAWELSSDPLISGFF